jgi:hypothetical protein
LKIIIVFSNTHFPLKNYNKLKEVEKDVNCVGLGTKISGGKQVDIHHAYGR